MNIHRQSIVRRISLFLALVVPAAAGIAVLGPDAAAAGTGTTVSTSPAGCPITVRVKNATKKKIIVNWGKSQVMVKGGWWTGLANNSRDDVKPGESKSILYGAFFGCDAPRRYQINTSVGESEAMATFPSVHGFTKDTTPTIVIKE